MQIRSKDDLKLYVLRRLGHPVIKINVEESQLQDRLDDALAFYQLYSSEAQKTEYIKHIVSQDEIDAKSINIGDDVLAVSKVFPTYYNMNSISWFSPEYQTFIRELKELQTGNLENYYITERHISLLNFILGKTDVSFKFNEFTKELSLTTDWSNLTPGESFLIIQATKKIDPNKYKALWDSYWLKELAYYYVLRQWAANLKKYMNIQLPGGTTLNAAEMMEEAIQKIGEIQQQLKDVSDPLPFFEVG